MIWNLLELESISYNYTFLTTVWLETADITAQIGNSTLFFFQSHLKRVNLPYLFESHHCYEALKVCLKIQSWLTALWCQWQLLLFTAEHKWITQVTANEKQHSWNNRTPGSNLQYKKKLDIVQLNSVYDRQSLNNIKYHKATENKEWRNCVHFYNYSENMTETQKNIQIFRRRVSKYLTGHIS